MSAVLAAVSKGENCIRMRQIHSSEKEVTSELLLQKEARNIRSLGLAKYMEARSGQNYLINFLLCIFNFVICI